MIRVYVALIAFGVVASVAGAAEIVRLDESNWSTHAPTGKEVDAIYGDYALVNDDVVAIVANPIAGRNANLKYRDVGGNLIDLATRRQGGDLLHVFYAATHRVQNARQKHVFRSARIEKAAGDSVALVCKAQTGSKELELRVRYVLGDGDPLRVETTWVNKSKRDLLLSPYDDVQHSSLERLHTGPSGAAAFESDSWWQGYALLPVDANVRVSPSGRTETHVVRYREAEPKDLSGAMIVPAGGKLTLARWVIAGPDGLSVQERAAKLRGVPMRRPAIAVTDAKGPAEATVIQIKSGDKRYGSQRVVDGRATPGLPEGAFEVTSKGIGRTDRSAKVPEKGEPAIAMKMDRPGFVSARITGAGGGPTPCKVQFIGINGTKSPRWFSRTGEHRVRNCYHSHNGVFTTAIGPGEYRVIVSYGPEHDAIKQEITVARDKTVELKQQLVRSVDTTGWISADFHAHSSPSGDNDASQFGRVLSILVEQLDYVPCTEHQRVDSYVPHLKRLGVEHLLGTSTGMELTGTPLPVNHQNAFPLVHKPRTQDGGGPRVDNDAVKQISRLALWDDASDKLVQQNHPNIPQITGRKQKIEGKLSEMLPHMDVIEVHPPHHILLPRAVDKKTGNDAGANRIGSWIELINRGVYVPGVVNTDAHYNFHGMGFLRNWIKSPTDDPAKIDTLDVVHESERGHIVMSTGPFMQVTATTGAPGSKPAIPGDTIAAPDGKAKVHVRVQCPNWHDINRVFVLVNGEKVDALNVTRKAHADRFGDGVVKFDQAFEVSVQRDAHLIVVAVGEGLRLGEVMGPEAGKLPPIAVSNPIFLDVDGGGFRAVRAPVEKK